VSAWGRKHLLTLVAVYEFRFAVSDVILGVHVGDAVMKKFALLFVVLPLSAFAASESTAQQSFALSKQTSKYIAKAESYCRSNDIGPSDSHYTKCVNGYLQDQYELTLGRAADGSIRVANYSYSQDHGPMMDPNAFGNPPSSNVGVWPQTPGR
jgi:hypothetical protein